jgi:uncharacterized repeat protein (TIGR01451 family)
LASAGDTLYSTQVTIEDLNPLTGAVKSKVALDFIIKLTATPGVPPKFDTPPTPACGSTLTGTTGTALTFTVSASDADVPLQTVTLNAAGLPAGATMTPALPTTGNPVTSTFSWTPTAAQTGSHVVTFTAADDTGLQALCSLTIAVSGGADLSITKADAPDPVALGGNLTYTLTVTNNGPDPSSDSTVSDPLPAGVAFVSATSSQGSCSQSGGTVTCTLGALAVGSSATIEIVVTVNPTAVGPLSDTATVTGAEPDPVASNNAATAETAISVPVLDHFKCYQTKQMHPKFDPRDVVLTDQFNTERVNVSRPEAACNPVDKDGSGISNPSAHLACYTIRDVQADEFPPFERRRVEATDQFGTHTLLLKDTSALCLPASKSPAGEVPGPPPTGLDHFKCYRTKEVGTMFDPRDVVLTDQFNTERVNVVGPETFCNPVDKDGSGISNPSAHLACYTIRDVQGDEFPPFEPRHVAVGDQFGMHRLLMKKTQTLCVPSSKTEL